MWEVDCTDLEEGRVVMWRRPVGGRRKGRLGALRQCRLGSDKTDVGEISY